MNYRPIVVQVKTFLASEDGLQGRTDLVTLQYLRAIAAVGVLVFHAADRTGSRFGPGAAGVDVFFVISGFIMWVIGARRSPAPLDFLKRRAQRIVPLYWLVTLVLAGTWMAAPHLFPHLQPSLSRVAMSLLFVPHADASGNVLPLVEPGWTLNYEAFFYLVFAASMFAAPRRRLAALTACLLLLVLLGAVLRLQSPLASTYTNPLLLEFLAGVWLGWGWTRGRAPSLGVATLMLAGGVGILVAIELTATDIAAWRVLAWGAPAVLVVWGALGIEKAGRLPRWRLPYLLGDASYSIYLVHGLAIAMVIHLCSGLAAGSGALVFVAAIAFSLSAGVACYLVVERPLTLVLHRRTASLAPAPKPLDCASGMRDGMC